MTVLKLCGFIADGVLFATLIARMMATWIVPRCLALAGTPCPSLDSPVQRSLSTCTELALPAPLTDGQTAKAEFTTRPLACLRIVHGELVELNGKSSMFTLSIRALNEIAPGPAAIEPEFHVGAVCFVHRKVLRKRDFDLELGIYNGFGVADLLRCLIGLLQVGSR